MSIPTAIRRHPSKRKTGWYTCWYDERAHSRRWRKLGDTMPIARMQLVKLQKDMSAGVLEKRFERITFREYAAIYKRDMLTDRRRKSWHTKQRAHIDHYITPRFAHVYLDEIKLYDAEAWYRDMLAKRYQPGKNARIMSTFTQCYCAHIAQTFKTMLRRAEGKYFDVSPIRGLKVKPAERRIPSTLTREQVGYMAQHLTGRDRVMLTLWVSTGLRKSEMQWLQWQDVDMDAGKLYVRGKEGHEIKDSEDRSIDLTREVLDVLRPFAEGKAATAFVFTDPQGAMIREIEHYARRLFKKCRMKGSANLFRHTFASMFLSGGGSIPELKAYMGHSSITITERHYAAFVPGRERSIHKIDFGLNSQVTGIPGLAPVLQMGRKAVNS